MEKRFGVSLGAYYKGQSKPEQPVVESPKSVESLKKPAPKPVFEQKGANKKNEKQ